MKQIAILALSLALPLSALAEEGEKKKVDYRPEFHGTVRAKYEYQPEVNAGRFQVRNARISVSGNVAPIVRDIYDAYFGKQTNPDPAPQENTLIY